MFGSSFPKTKVDLMILGGALQYDLSDKGILVRTNKGDITVTFDKERFRPSDVPILLSDTAKIERLGFKVQHGLKNIIRDQLDYWETGEN